MRPPFSITTTILSEVSQIERLIGRVEGLHQPRPQPHLRKLNRVKTVQGSLAIEGNTLALDQVTAILEGKRVLGDRREILEVQNAIRAYDRLTSYKAYSAKALLQAHGILMNGLIRSAGAWRSGSVGVLKGSHVSHMAPKADRVPQLMEDLMAFLKTADTHPLITGCIFHYELEFIHPFEDGNGRAGRLWHSVLLHRFHPVFEFIPVESLIKEHQAEYYQALEASDQAGNSTIFIEFMLAMIRQALSEFLDALRPEPVTPEARLTLAQGHFGQRAFSRKDYLAFFKTLSTATASRDLKLGADNGILEKSGKRALTTYRFG